MKRVGNLKEKWCNYDTLLKAFNEVKIGKSFHYLLVEYESNLAVNLNNLLKHLESGVYTPKEPREFYVYEPKKRLIHAPHLEDRIVQHAVLIAIRDLVEKRFIFHSYACRKEKGTHNASEILSKWLIEYKNVGYYLKIDITKFFYNINHEKLKQKLSRIIKCRETLVLLSKFIDNESGKGLPLGNVTSQLFANLSLNEVDHFIKREIKAKHYIRYMDDLLILHENKTFLKEALSKIVNIIYSECFQINSKTKIAKISEGIDFVGYKTWYNRKIIRKRTLFNIKRKLKKGDDLERISSFLSHAKRTDSIEYVAKTISEASPQHTDFVANWVYNNRPDVHLKVFSQEVVYH